MYFFLKAVVVEGKAVGIDVINRKGLIICRYRAEGHENMEGEYKGIGRGRPDDVLFAAKKTAKKMDYVKIG